MKRILIFAVILSLIFCTFGCKSEQTDDVALPDGSTEAVIGGADEPTDIVVTPDSQTPTPEPEPEKDPEPSVPNTPVQNDEPATPSEPEKKAPDYKSYSCRSESEITWQALRFKIASTEVEIQLELPSDWTLQSTGGGVYNITLANPLRSWRRQRVIYDHDRHLFYALPVDNTSSDRLYFSVDEVIDISEP